MAGTSYIISGHTKSDYSIDSFIKTVKTLNISSGVATTYSLVDNEEVTEVTYNWVDNEYDGEVKRIGFESTKELIAICDDYFVRFIQCKIKIDDDDVDIFLGTTIHENNSVTFYIQFDYSFLLHEENLERKKRRTTATRELCCRFYSTGLFEFGNAGEEITELSLEDVCTTNAIWETGDFYSSKNILSSERTKQLLNLPVFCVLEIGNDGYFIAIEEFIHEMKDNNVLNKFTGFLENLSVDLRKKKLF